VTYLKYFDIGLLSMFHIDEVSVCNSKDIINAIACIMESMYGSLLKYGVMDEHIIVSSTFLNFEGL
jgi:hypothetical protein